MVDLVAVPIVLSAAVDEAGGESVRIMSVLRGQNERRCCGRCMCLCRPLCPTVLAAAACVVLAVVVVSVVDLVIVLCIFQIIVIVVIVVGGYVAAVALVVAVAAVVPVLDAVVQQGVYVNIL